MYPPNLQTIIIACTKINHIFTSDLLLKRSFRNLIPVWGAVVITLSVLVGCEDGGVVGSAFLPSNPSLRVDTISTLTISTEPLVAYAGNKGFVAMGRYEDALFGTFEAVAMLTPGLISTLDTLTNEYRYGIVLRPTQTYGDTMSTTVFDVYEIQKRWRAQEWRMDDRPVLGSTPITRFELGYTDSLFVELPSSWVERYLSYYQIDATLRDSAYVNSEFGFAFVPVSGNKISYLNSNDNLFLVERADTTNLFSGIRQRASNYNQTAPGVETDHALVIMNDFTKTGTFSFHIDEQVVGAKVVSRAELVFYEDRARLAATLPIGHTRFSNQIIQIFELADDEKEYYITKDPITSVLSSADDGSYRVNITNLVNASIADGGRSFNYYMITDVDNGIIRPNLIMNQNAGLRAPRIIITRVEANQ